jgi:putative transposase
MKYDPDAHHRRSIRLQGYDYSQAGAYFVSIIAQSRECIFGDVVDDQVVLSPVGELIQQIWMDLPARFAYCALDAFVVMPNHIHGIIVIDRVVQELVDGGTANGSPIDGHVEPPVALGAIIRVFKSLSAIQVNRLLARPPQPLWQRNYYEHIVRDDEDLNRTRQYIMDNPVQWAIDRENPAVVLPGH